MSGRIDNGIVVYGVVVAATTDVTPLNGSCKMISSVGVAVMGVAVGDVLLSVHIVECPIALVGVVNLSLMRGACRFRDGGRRRRAWLRI